MMLKAGVSVTKGVGILSQQAKSSSFKKILRQVQEDLQKGKTFADSLDVFPHVFPEMFTSMVRVGELSGRLEEVMKNLSLQLQKDHQLIARIRGAMTYPTIVLLAMIGVGIVMMTMVLPQLSDIFRDIDAELPITTRTLMAVGDFTGDNVILVLAGALVAVILFIVFMKFRLTKPLWHQILLFFPLIGGVVKKVNLARFARTVSSLLKSGVSMVTALEIVSKTLGNVHFRKATGAAGKEIVKGVSLVSVFEKNPRLFPPMVTQMIAIGEETGELDAILLQLAGF
ncbi:MAG: type IV pilus assembly protein PilC, partial [uncultured bacterium]